jgi:hypothetical protein
VLNIANCRGLLCAGIAPSPPARCCVPLPPWLPIYIYIYTHTHTHHTHTPHTHTQDTKCLVRAPYLPRPRPRPVRDPPRPRQLDERARQSSIIPVLIVTASVHVVLEVLEGGRPAPIQKRFFFSSCLRGKITTIPSILCPKDPIRSHLCDRGNPCGGPWSKEEGGQGAVPRLLPATEHRAWAGAHAPGALLPRASWTTGAWAPSSRGPGAGREGRTWSPCCRWDNSFSILQPAHVRSFKCCLTPWFLVRPSEPLTSVLL